MAPKRSAAKTTTDSMALKIGKAVSTNMTGPNSGGLAEDATSGSSGGNLEALVESMMQSASNPLNCYNLDASLDFVFTGPYEINALQRHILETWFVNGIFFLVSAYGKIPLQRLNGERPYASRVNSGNNRHTNANQQNGKLSNGSDCH